MARPLSALSFVEGFGVDQFHLEAVNATGLHAVVYLGFITYPPAPDLTPPIARA
jgi:hypothetical protein